MATVPTTDMARVADAQSRFENLIRDVTDAQVRQPSALPGWTVGHVLSHVARNADSHRRRSEAAVRSEVVEQYPGGFDGRAREIEAGASRDAAALVADVRESAQRMAAAWADVPEEAWARVTRDVGGRERPLHALVGRRWQELEVHGVDLGLGATRRDWPDDFVSVWLPRLRATRDERLPAGATVPSGLDDRDELAWLYGRLQRDDLPDLAPWA